MLKVATALPNEPYREYKDVERVYSGSTEIDKILDKNGNVLFAVNKEAEGTPALTYKGKEETNLKNYRIYGNTETKTRSYSGSAPLSFPIEDGSVSNYRIYGNTVNGESMGDKTVNILPLSRTPITETHGDFLCEYDGLGTITLTTDKDNATTDGEFVIPLIQDFTIPVSIRQGGTGCLQINNSISGIATNNIKLYYNNTQIDTWNLNELNRLNPNYTGMGNKTINSISVRINNGGTNRKITIKPAFVENVTEQVPFEPYGYRIPITNNSETANIYLDEPLRKVGDEAEYIDYGEQKQHRVRKNLLQNTATSRTINGVTFTVNADGSVVCSGTATQTVIYMLNDTFSLEPGTYKLTGCPAGGEYVDKYKLDIVVPPITYGTDIGNGSSFTLSSALTNGQYRIIIYKNQTCDNLTFYPMVHKADIEDDTYEPYIENTEVDVTLPALPAQSSSNSLSVGTAVQPSSVAVDVDEVVSCGDRTVNILPMPTTPISTDIDDFHCEYDGAGTITLTTDKDNAVLNQFSIWLSEDFIIPISVGQGGDGCVQFNNSIATSVNSNDDHISVNFYYNHIFIDSWGLTTVNRIHSTYSSMAGKTMNQIIVEIKGTGFSTNRKIVIRPAFVLNTTEQVPFEPYGYKLPVTISNGSDTLTTPIYLPEPIKMVGDEAEYINYAGQKMHRIGADDIDVTLPELPVLPGTNTLTVGTEVQPSNVYLKGRIKEIT